ncbi:meiosis regulator and mRNA stability factor [Salix suchowensis]|nr:meiosis regulator and mRNA stability factor [Salix suchowensis]
MKEQKNSNNLNKRWKQNKNYHSLARMNYCGPVSISAYGDTHGINSAAQQALSSTGVSLNHVPPGVKDASDKKILVDMLFWAVDNPAPANYLLISGDRDFSNALHQLRMRRYNILLAQPKTASAPLVAAAKSVWLWTSLLAGGQPLSEGELQQLVSKNYTSSPGTTQIPVSGAAQMKEPVDSHSEKPHLANQNSPSTARGIDGEVSKETRVKPMLLLQCLPDATELASQECLLLVVLMSQPEETRAK